MENISHSQPAEKTIFNTRQINILSVIAFSFVFLIVGFTIGKFITNTQTSESPETVRDHPKINTAPEVTTMETSDLTQPENETYLCTNSECIYRSSQGKLVGLTQISGYYEKYDGTQWEWGNNPVECDALVYTGDKNAIVSEFMQTAQSGNLINKFFGDLFYINLDLSQLDTNQIAVLKESNAESPVTLTVLRPEPLGRGSSTCGSFVTILSIE